MSVAAELRWTDWQKFPEFGSVLQSLFRAHALLGSALHVPGALYSAVQLAVSVHTCAAGHALFLACRRSSRAHDQPMVSL